MRAGERLRLLCYCTPRRCHAQSIVQWLLRRAQEGASGGSDGGGGSNGGGGEAAAGGGGSGGGNDDVAMLETPDATSAMPGGSGGAGGGSSGDGWRRLEAAAATRRGSRCGRHRLGHAGWRQRRGRQQQRRRRRQQHGVARDVERPGAGCLDSRRHPGHRPGPAIVNLVFVRVTRRLGAAQAIDGCAVGFRDGARATNRVRL